MLISSGSEVALVLKAQEQLKARCVAARAVSIPSLEVFEKQDKSYRSQVLPPGVPRVAIEPAHPNPWYRLVGESGIVLDLERYGASAPYETIYKELGLTVDKIVETAASLV